MEAREEFSRLMAWLIKNSDEVDSDQIKADIIRYRAVNRWDEDDFFDEWANPSSFVLSQG